MTETNIDLKIERYETKCPVFPSVRILWNRLSEQDSCFQTNQIALEFFKEHIQLTNIEPDVFIKSLAKKYKISTGSNNWEENNKKIAKSYLVQTHNIAELFFKELKKDIVNYKAISSRKSKHTIGNSNKNIDPFNQIVENLETEKQRLIKRKPEYYLINYYRLVRNGIVHSSEDSFNKPLEYFNKNIKPIINYFKGYYKFTIEVIPAPNSPSDLTFRDFILYSRTLRYLTNYISDQYNLNSKEIFEIHKHESTFKEFLPKRYHNKDQDPLIIEKIIKASIYSYLKFNFKIESVDYTEKLYLEFVKSRENSKTS